MACLTCLVTGANRGIGFCIAKRLAQVGNTVILGCRSAQRAREAIERLVSEFSIPRSHLKFLPLDLSQPDSASAAITILQSISGEGIDVLVNNAAVLSVSDAMAGTVLNVNYFSTAAFTRSLRDLRLFRSDGPKRIVNIGSSWVLNSVQSAWQEGLLAKYLNAASFDAIDGLAKDYLTNLSRFATAAAGGDALSLEQYGGHHGDAWDRGPYGISKVALMGFTRLAHKLWGPDGIVVSSCDPGWTDTKMARTAIADQIAPQTPDEGARVVEWLALNSTLDGHGGKLWKLAENGSDFEEKCSEF